MAKEIVMPKLGLTMTEGTIESWYKKEGEAVQEGEKLFSVSTDKLTNDVEATASGVLLRVLVAAGGTVPCIPYLPFGSAELAETAAEAMRDANAVLLGGHGLLCGGPEIARAFDTAEQIEFVAELYYRTELLGGAPLLDGEQLADVRARFETYGQPSPSEARGD